MAVGECQSTGTRWTRGQETLRPSSHLGQAQLEPSPDHIVVPQLAHRRCQTAHDVSASRCELSGQPWPWHTGQAGSRHDRRSPGTSPRTPRSRRTCSGSISNRPRNESVLCSASVWHEKSHAPQPMHSDSRTVKLIAQPAADDGSATASCGWKWRSSPMQSACTHGAHVDPRGGGARSRTRSPFHSHQP